MLGTLTVYIFKWVNISPSQVNEGDRIIMWCDHSSDIFTKVIPASIYNEELS